MCETLYLTVIFRLDETDAAYFDVPEKPTRKYQTPLTEGA